MKQVAFLFDNDGVLIDSSSFHWQSWQLLMEQEPDLQMNETSFTNAFGKRNDLILKDLLPHLTDDQRNDLARRKEALFRSCAQGKIALLPGMEAFLQQVVAANIPHIIASSTPPENLEMLLKTTVLGIYFDRFVSAEEVPHGKPAPDVFIEAAHRLGFDPAECIVFEDSQAGIDAARSAGCFVVALETTAPKSALSGYDVIYPSARELNLQKILSAKQ